MGIKTILFLPVGITKVAVSGGCGKAQKPESSGASGLLRHMESLLMSLFLPAQSVASRKPPQTNALGAQLGSLTFFFQENLATGRRNSRKQSNLTLGEFMSCVFLVDLHLGIRAQEYHKDRKHDCMSMSTCRMLLSTLSQSLVFLALSIVSLFGFLVSYLVVA